MRPPVRTLRESSSLKASCSAESTPIRPADNSMASGMPSKYRHTCATACPLRRVNWKEGLRWWARSTNSLTDS